MIGIPLKAYIVCRYDRESIDKVSFSCPEINFIHPVNDGLTIGLPGFEKKGVITVKTSEFKTNRTDVQTFNVDGVEVHTYFDIYRTISISNNDRPPLESRSVLAFEFPETKQYALVFRLWGIARQFIRYLCYRKNICMSAIEVFAPYEDGKHEEFGRLYILEKQSDEETGTLNDRRYIAQRYISGFEGKILNQ